MRLARNVRRRAVRFALAVLRTRDDQEVLVEADGEPRLPLSVGEVLQRVAAEALLGEPRRQVGAPPQQIVHAAWVRREPRHVADEMHDRFALRDVVFEHMQRVAAERLEVLLDFDLDVRPSQRVAERVAVGPELVRDAGNEKSDAPVRHSGLQSRVARLPHGK